MASRSHGIVCYNESVAQEVYRLIDIVPSDMLDKFQSDQTMIDWYFVDSSICDNCYKTSYCTVNRNTLLFGDIIETIAMVQ